jgi:hypothetical protein
MVCLINFGWEFNSEDENYFESMDIEKNKY